MANQQNHGNQNNSTITSGNFQTFSLFPYTFVKYRCTNCIAIPPSSTPGATVLQSQDEHRLLQKSQVCFVSRRKGSRSNVQPRSREFRFGITSGPVKIKPFLSLSIIPDSQSTRGCAPIYRKKGSPDTLIFSSLSIYCSKF